MQYFNATNYLGLEDKIKSLAASGDPDGIEDLSFLKKAMLSFVQYVFKVGEERIEVRFAKGVQKGEELKNTVSYFDSTRHTAHETAIVNVNMLNRIAAAYNVDNIFTGDASNRVEIGCFCGEVSAWLFENRYT